MPNTFTADWLLAYAASAGISLRQSLHQDAQKFTIIGPRRPARSTDRPPPRHGSVTSGIPFFAFVAGSRGQSGMSVRFLNATRSGLATSTWDRACVTCAGELGPQAAS